MNVKKDIIRDIIYNEAIKQSEASQHEPTPEGWFRASEVGACPRILYYSRINAEIRQTRKKNIFRMEDGTARHKKFQEYLATAGLLEKAEFLVMDEKNRIVGHPDGIIKHSRKRYILEIKTVGKWYFGRVKGGPTLSHYQQANFYGINTGIKNLYFIYYCADNGDTKEFESTTSIEVYNKLVESLDFVRECINKKEVPENTITDYCFACGYEYLCKGLLATESK